MVSVISECVGSVMLLACSYRDIKSKSLQMHVIYSINPFSIQHLYLERMDPSTPGAYKEV
jgi:hypothetical protein